MNRYGYTLKKNITEEIVERRYHETDLRLMTVFQLREICREEKIIPGMVRTMEKEELIRVIMRYRGADEYFLIRKPDELGESALAQVIQRTRLCEKHDLELTCVSKIIAYEGLAIGFYDGIKIPYHPSIVGTNALVVSGDKRICAILNVEQLGEDRRCLYLTKAAGTPCQESDVKHYNLYCMNRINSEILYRIYAGNYTYMPEYLEVYRIPLMDFEVRRPIPLSMPLSVDFGSSNTVAGAYLDSLYFEQSHLHDGELGLRKDEVNYTLFYDTSSDCRENILFPSVVGVLAVKEEAPQFVFGYDAMKMANSSYIDEGFCIFYDIKRWIRDYEKQEEMTDRQGHRRYVKRKDILKAYFEYVIAQAENRLKCKVGSIHISCPAKHKSQFQRLFQEILPQYILEEQDMIDEGVSVLYHVISGMIERGTAEEGKEYRALIVDCGGGTSDLYSCGFRITDKRVAYKIEIENACENTDADFGGNNLTYRIMQLLKIVVVNQLYEGCIRSKQELLGSLNLDVYRYVDQYGTKGLYEELEAVYEEAEHYLPTKFSQYENQSRAEYYQVKNNFYVLFRLAEAVKREFYNHIDTLRVVLSSEPVEEGEAIWIRADKWKLSLRNGGRLETVKEMPSVYFSIYEIELLLKGDIYGLMSRFMEKIYENQEVEDYSIIKLTGQSCKVELFRDALKEFVAGKMIQFKRKAGDISGDYELKMDCVDGALRYLKDKKYGFADVTIHTAEPALPYSISAFTHTGKEIILIHPLARKEKSGTISRNMEELTLNLFLKDMAGNVRCQYTCYSSFSDFEEKRYEEIEVLYGSHIPQGDTDSIVDGEVKFFVWADSGNGVFFAVPVYRKAGQLYLGKKEEFSFENDGWVQNFFDGMK